MINNNLEVENLSFGYDKKKIFNNINLNMESGFITVIGPNGCGKSTLIKLISGLLTPDTGNIKINENRLNTISPKEKAKLFTVIGQKQNFPFPFTCLEMVSIGRYPYRRNMNNLSNDDYEIIIQAMKDTDTLKFKDKMITDISGGEQQRVILASAFAQDTKIIYLDEAFSALDISHKANIIKILKEKIAKKNILVLSIMHDLNIAYRYSDKVLIIDSGKVAGFDNPKVVMTSKTISEVFDVDIELVEGKGFFINIYK